MNECNLMQYLEKIDNTLCECVGHILRPDKLKIEHAISNNNLVLTINDYHITVYLDVNELEILIGHLNNILPLYKEYLLTRILEDS